jgi:pimeloyl-ACP methyl ester carboxylesterase
MGGLITQLLLDRGVGVAGIILDPAPVAGALVGPQSLSAAFPILARLNGWNRPFLLSRDAFAKNFANTVSREESDAAWDRYVVPTSGRIFHQAALMLGTAVNAKARKQPLLVIEGTEDRTVTPFVAKNIFNVQKKSRARTDYKEFAGRSHYIAGEKGWEEVAAYAIDWAGEVTTK